MPRTPVSSPSSSSPQARPRNIPMNKNHDRDLPWNQGSETTYEQQKYDSATWRMYHRICKARGERDSAPPLDFQDQRMICSTQEPQSMQYKEGPKDSFIPMFHLAFKAPLRIPREYSYGTHHPQNYESHWCEDGSDCEYGEVFVLDL